MTRPAPTYSTFWSYSTCMKCNLDSSARQLRLLFGAPMFLLGMLLVILVYLQIIDSWGWFIGSAGMVLGLGGVLSACYGTCMLQSVIDR